MNDFVPSTLFDAQALKVLQALLSDRLKTQHQEDLTPDDLLAVVREGLQRLIEKAGSPMFDHLVVREGEPPDSRKMNRLWESIISDIQVAQHQLDLNRAASIDAFNQFTTELSRARLENQRIENKVKSLQLYAEGSSDNTVVFADRFRSLEGLDPEFVPSNLRPALLDGGQMTLALEGVSENYIEKSNVEVRVLDDNSNGLKGRNQLASKSADSATVVFLGDNLELDDMDRMVDAEPNTWFEYEGYEVSAAVRNSVNNLGFEYLDVENNARIDWAEAPTGDVLRLSVEVDLKDVYDIDEINLTPHRIRSVGNSLPYRVKNMRISTDGTNWERVAPVDVVFNLDSNLSTLREAASAVIGRAVWKFNRRVIQKIRFEVEQANPYDVEVGHSYWVDKDTEERVEGVIPELGRIEESRSQTSTQQLEQRFEILPARRWAIALKDIEAKQSSFVNESIFVSRALQVNGVIDRVSLNFADYEIPAGFDPNTRWVKFYISIDEGVNWHPIAEIEDIGESGGPPEVISFNDPLPDALRESRVKNVASEAGKTVDRLRVKIELSRPEGIVNATPVVHGYGLKVLLR